VILRRRPNNAMLLGFKTYNTGQVELARLLEDCGGDWRRFFAVMRTLSEDRFGEEQTDEIGPVIDKLRCQGAAAARSLGQGG